MLMTLNQSIIVSFICLLFAVSPVIGAMSHVCDDGHETSSAADGTDHNDSHCGCTCHGSVEALVDDGRLGHAMPVTIYRHIEVAHPVEFTLSALERPPRLFS